MLCASMHIWPKPTGSVSLSTTAIPVRADLFHLTIITASSKAVHDHLQEAFFLFREDLKLMQRNAAGFTEWRGVAVRISVNGSGDPRLLINTDESYKLDLQPKSDIGGALAADISAKSFCGARHGLETLLQLIWMDPYVGSLMILHAATIEDAPRFKYRGLMLDTARNYFPEADILRTIDAMAASKLNTFHWHVSDAQSFPLVLNSVPDLATLGAYGPGAMYSTKTIKNIVDRARLRGIRVLIEVDVPAHVGCAWDWITSPNYELVHCLASEPWPKYCNDPPCGQLNPQNPNVYRALENIYSEIIQLTGVDDIFHLGGDDLSKRCWQDNFKNVDPMRLFIVFTRAALKRLEISNGKLPNLTLLWGSELSEYLKTDLKDYVHALGIQIRSPEWAQQKYLNGIRTILSHEVPWDLNSGTGAWNDEGGGVPFNSWQRIYEHRPWSRGGATCLEGGEVTIWAWTLNAAGLDARVWPRAAAFAERMWSDRPEGATRVVHARLDVHRSRLVARGIQAAPIWSMWCTHNAFTCG